MKFQKIKLFTLVLLITASFLWTGCQPPNSPLPTNSFIDSRDGEIYATITIGSQTWMAENLRYDAPGSLLNPNNPSIAYGRLYNWPTVMNGSPEHTPFTTSNIRGICPNGWHIPSDGEWTTLEIAHGMDPIDSISNNVYRGSKGRAFKSKTEWVEVVPGWNENGLDSLGFNGLPAGGSGEVPQAPYGLGVHTMFWSSSLRVPYFPWTRALGLYPYVNAHRTPLYELSYTSCRCIQD